MLNRFCRSSLLLTFALLLTAAGPFARPAAADPTVIGTVTRIGLSPGTLSVLTDSGTVTFAVLPSTWVTKDGMDADLTNLRVGDQVRAAVFASAGGMTALRVDAQSQGHRKTLRGGIVSVLAALGQLLVDLNGNSPNGLVTLSIDATTIFVRDGSPAAVSDLQIGDGVIVLASISSNGAAAVRVEASSPRSQPAVILTGIVKAITGRQVVIQTWKAGMEEIVRINPGSPPRKNKKLVTAGDIERGDQVIVFGTRDSTGIVTAFNITLQSPDTRFSGTVTAVDESQGSIVVKPQKGGGAPRTVLIYPATVLQLNGQDAEIGDIRVGDTADVRCVIHTDGPWGATSIDITRAKAGSG